ncbi:MAG: hypothetical protein HC835_21040 [Oscillatoriales cyanobacterium RM2_1_1]|nr:hypothetical protein [Oscillatoriales cyanobacterium SM2_3_0]NJO47886.1 hypothetical protein [Oscillatoriales cyanobacterium RM2_1_1]
MKLNWHPILHQRLNSNFLTGLGFRGNPMAGLITAISLNLIPQLISQPALAQTNCQAPGAGEYLVLVVSQTEADQDLARRSLPEDVESQVCRYLEDTVTRLGGFGDRLIAQDWANFIADNIGLQAYVVKPDNPPTPDGISARPPASLGLGSTKPSTGQSQPEVATQSQGISYAILVDYLNQPELAAQVERATGQKIGLASYGQRSYLLVKYTDSLDEANIALQNLSRQGFWPFVVDRRRVTVISPEIN